MSQANPSHWSFKIQPSSCVFVGRAPNGLKHNVNGASWKRGRVSAFGLNGVNVASACPVLPTAPSFLLHLFLATKGDSLPNLDRLSPPSPPRVPVSEPVRLAPVPAWRKVKLVLSED